MNRFDRITAILIQLQSKKVVKAQDLANRFGISLRTVYRDIRSLEEAGVPLYGEAGVGYSLVDGYRLPPVMFTPNEAIAFITAEKLMGNFADAALQKHYTEAMFKIKAVLRGSEKDLIENLEDQIIVSNKPGNTSSSTGNTLDVLLKAIADKKAVAITYRAFAKEDNTERIIEPIGIFHENNFWHTIAYCHLRKTYRQFRIDRIISITLTAQSQQEHTSLKEYRDTVAKVKSFALHKSVIRIDKKAAPYIQDQKHFYGFVSEIVTDEYIDMTFLSQWADDGIARWFMMFADYAEILEPQSLKNRVNELLETYLQKNTSLQITADKGLS
ncbi:WYL domain-containing protein [Flavobacterium sp. Sd200]|uniref:helix-turn-helix transcriptional regulator n=1 Tax=Flavobacterium sp. Sd200 TaxID=2692211 RepID=UPI0013696340|nr:YafY family protein [Flavobacterium sp. Sd200]MXN90554.1 WYL domain-containing protein [Flavobacterium sp. Sd200]